MNLRIPTSSPIFTKTVTPTIGWKRKYCGLTIPKHRWLPLRWSQGCESANFLPALSLQNEGQVAVRTVPGLPLWEAGRANPSFHSHTLTHSLLPASPEPWENPNAVFQGCSFKIHQCFLNASVVSNSLPHP